MGHGFARLIARGGCRVCEKSCVELDRCGVGVGYAGWPYERGYAPGEAVSECREENSLPGFNPSLAPSFVQEDGCRGPCEIPDVFHEIESFFRRDAQCPVDEVDHGFVRLMKKYEIEVVEGEVVRGEVVVNGFGDGL